MAVKEPSELALVLADEAAHHDALAEEMARLASDGCRPDFADALRAIARNHRIRAIELRSRLSVIGGADRD